MLLVELINQFLHVAKILRRFAASPYITVTRTLYKTMELPVALLRVENAVNFTFLRVVDDHVLRIRWRLAGGWGSRAVKQREVGNVVLPDGIWKV